jgi:hypothetical protein
MVEPNKLLLADPRIPRITFAGKEWPIPKLAIDQLAEVWPLISGSLISVVSAGAGASIAAFSGQTIKDMSKVVFWGLKRGHESLSPEEYADMPSDVQELMNAVLVVASQTGGFKLRTPGEAATPEGEAVRAPHLNGTPSRPKSALARAGRGPRSAQR